MESGRPIRLVSVTGPGEMQVSTEGIQFLQELNEPLAVVCIVGPPQTGKTTVANWLIERPHGFDTPTTEGLWAWSEPLRALQKDEKGDEREVNILIIDCQATIGGEDAHQTSRLFALSCLLSSQLLFVLKEPFSPELFQQLEHVNQISSVIQIQKNQDSKSLLSNYMPGMAWAVCGLELKQGEPANIILERALNKQNPDILNTNKTRVTIKQFFKKRACFALGQPAAPEDMENFRYLERDAYYPGFVQGLTSLSEYLKKNSDIKKVLGKNISGGVLCNMLQAFVHRFQKQAPAVIIGAFQRAVAAQARRNKQKLFILYLDKMGLMEDDMPHDQETLWKEHHDTYKKLLVDFDKMMMHVFQQEEVQQQRTSLVERIENYYDDLKTANIKSSQNKCREVFKAVFENIRKQGLRFAQDGSVSISETEKNLLGAIQNYQELARGPSIQTVFAQEIDFLIPYMSSLFRELQSHHQADTQHLTRELKTVTKNRDEARTGQKRLRELLEQTNRNYEKQLEQRDKQISDLQANVNTRIHQTENKIRSQTREIQGLRLELEQSQKEREMMIQAERDIYEKRIADLQSKLYKLQLDNSKYERIIDDLREEQENQIVQKNQQINELSRKVKLMETQSDPSPRQDATLLRSFREYLDQIFNKFSAQQHNNTKSLAQLQKIASLQNELNSLRISQQENRHKLSEEFEELIRTLKQEKETQSKQYREQTEKQKEELKLTLESVNLGVQQQKKAQSERDQQIKRLMEEKLELNSQLAKKEQHLSDQYEVIDIHKQQIEQLQQNSDDRDNLINRLKIEIVEEKDDNDILIQLTGMIIDNIHKKRQAQAIPIKRIQNHENRIKIAKTLKKFGISYE